MRVLKGRIHHLAEGALSAPVGRALAVNAIVSGAAVAAGASGAVAAGAVVALGVAPAAGAVAVACAAVVAANTCKYRNAIPANTQQTWKRYGVGLLATFSLACGIGAGVWVHDQFPENDYNATQIKQAPPNTNKFNVEAGKTDECTIVVKNGTLEVLSGPCEVRPALK